MEDWYQISAKEFCKIGGYSMLPHYENSLQILLENMFPDFNWLPWKFSVMTKNYWNDISNQKKYMDWVSKELNIIEFSDWYNVSGKYLQNNFYGSSLLRKYNGSLSDLLKTIYPNYDWLPWKFDHCPNRYWEDIRNQRKFMDWAGKELAIKDMSDWYKISVKVF